jgi:partner of Y14 and mago protein
MRKEMASHIGPKGYDPQLDSKPKTKAVTRNEIKKEKKRLQVSLILFLFIYSISASV